MLAWLIALALRPAFRAEAALEPPTKAAASSSAPIHTPSNARRLWELPISSPPVPRGHASRALLPVSNTFEKKGRTYYRFDSQEHQTIVSGQDWPAEREAPA